MFHRELFRIGSILFNGHDNEYFASCCSQWNETGAQLESNDSDFFKEIFQPDIFIAIGYTDTRADINIVHRDVAKTKESIDKFGEELQKVFFRLEENGAAAA